jgi:hypothetical protein
MEIRHTLNSVFVILISLLLCLPASAQEKVVQDREGFRLGLELGAGSVERTVSDAEFDETNFYAGFIGGYWIGKHVLAGLELNGWLFQASNLNDPSVGEGISRVFAFTRIYPSTKYAWFVKAGGGYASYWNNRPGEPTGQSGSGFEVGGGYDFAIESLRRPWLITPFATYGSGKNGDIRHKAITIGVGFFYQF